MAGTILLIWIVLAYVAMASAWQTQVTKPLFYVGVALAVALGVYRMIQQARDRRPPEQ